MEIEDFLSEISGGTSALDSKRQSILPSASLISYDPTEEVNVPIDIPRGEDEYDLIRRFCKVKTYKLKLVPVFQSVKASLTFISLIAPIDKHESQTILHRTRS
ncbi:hypothetical protein EON65_56210 [archaeon]|nr:MAG: hypothetical protein EON65_56210 [archaeon]